MSDSADSGRDKYSARDEYGARDEFRSEVAAAVAATTETARGTADRHPGLDELIAYHAGELSDPEAERIRSHLVGCSPCVDQLLELEEFVRVSEADTGDVASFEEAASWRALRSRLGRPRRSVPLAVAASFLVAALGLGLWATQQRMETTELRERLARLAQPQADAAIVDLFPPSSARSVGEQPPVTPTAAADHLTVILHVEEAPDADAFEAAITDTEGRELWSGPIQASEYGTFLLGIPRPFLDAGSYRIVLYAVTGDRRQPIETYALELASGAG